MNIAEKLENLKCVSSTDLVNNIKSLAAQEKKYAVAVIAHLAEINRRRLHLDMGYKGLFDYCTRGLGFSEGSSWLRVQVANKCLAVPALLEEMASGTISLSVVGTIATVLTDGNKEKVLSKSRGLTKRRAEELVAAWKPRPQVRSGIRAASIKRSLPTALALTDCERVEESQGNMGGDHTGRGSVPRGKVTPADRDTFNIRFAADKSLIQKLERLAEVLDKDAQRDLAEIFALALDDTLEKRDPMRRDQRRQKRQTKTRDKAVTPSPAPSQDSLEKEDNTSEKSRHIPAATRDAVLRRAGYRCEAVGRDGHRCTCRRGLQIDHRIPFGKGGRHQPENLQVLCRAHNLRKAELDYGIRLIGATG